MSLDLYVSRIMITLGLVSISCGNASGFYTEASLLYWKTDVNGLAYAVEAPSSGSSLGKSRVYNPSFRWGPGFNVSLGYQIPHDQWKIALQFTSYRTHCTTDLESAEDQVLFPIWQDSSQQDLQTFGLVHQHYRLHLGLVDLLLSKQLSISSCIDLIPYMGLSFVSVRQKYHLDYAQPHQAPYDPILWRMKNKFWGLGPDMGCRGNLLLWRGFSFFCDASLRLLYGEFYTHQGEREEISQIKTLRLFNHFFSGATVVTGTVGLRWQSQQWKVECGYDQSLFFAQNQLPHFLSNDSSGIIAANQGDLSLLGVHFTGGFIF